jgi:Ni/Co efflux regulator RcnB
MRKLLLSILLASVAATPALATQARDTNKNSTAQQYRDRPQHSGRLTAPSRTQPTHQGSRQSAPLASRPVPQGALPERVARPPRTERPNRIEKVPGTPVERRPEIVRRPPETRLPSTTRPAPRTLPKRPVVSTVPRPGTEPPLKPQVRPTPRPQWNTNWRNNRRYDWGDWRRHHRRRFHLHAYIDPFGWAYYRYWIGWRLWPGYYSSRFWIVDPWEYRLPPAPPGTRWIRYYNDALLVDMWSGEVVDVIHDFFW